MIEETQNWELMGEVYRQQTEALRKALAEKDKEIKRLYEVFGICARGMTACNCDENGVVSTERV